MKIAALIARILLGAIFTVFGLNGFLHFIPMVPPPGLAGQFLTVLADAHYIILVAGVQVIAGVLLLINRFVPLALVLLGPVIVNILAFHALMAPSGLPMAIVVAILWGILAWYSRRNLSGILAERIDVDAS